MVGDELYKVGWHENRSRDQKNTVGCGKNLVGNEKNMVGRRLYKGRSGRNVAGWLGMALRGKTVDVGGKPVSIAPSWHGIEDAAAPVRTRACGSVIGCCCSKLINAYR